MLKTLLTHLRHAQQRQASMGWLLRRADDRYLTDIGLTRADLEQLLAAAASRREAP
jgi:uncharacterized protein YjiS (DUF1127 family)